MQGQRNGGTDTERERVRVRSKAANILLFSIKTHRSERTETQRWTRRHNKPTNDNRVKKN